MKIAISGSPGAGKSTVLRMLEEFGHSVVQADAIAKEISAEPAVRERLAEITGFGPDTPIEARRARIFGDPGLRQRVNAILHPLVAERLKGHPATFHEIPLLVENGRTVDYNESWCVLCAESERLRRLTERYGNPETARLVTDSQLPEEVKRIFCDEEIRTDVPLAHVRTVIERLLRERFGEA